MNQKKENKILDIYIYHYAKITMLELPYNNSSFAT